jgi:periplasmic divalent cation tolerance protein
MKQPIVLIPTKEARIVLVTAPSEAEANAIARHLVEQQIAACVSLTPIHSIYRWDNAVESSSEFQLSIKTTANRLSALASAIREMHPYGVPEFLVVECSAGSAQYLAWLGASTSLPG